MLPCATDANARSNPSINQTSERQNERATDLSASCLPKREHSRVISIEDLFHQRFGGKRKHLPDNDMQKKDNTRKQSVMSTHIKKEENATYF